MNKFFCFSDNHVNCFISSSESSTKESSNSTSCIHGFRYGPLMNQPLGAKLNIVLEKINMDTRGIEPLQSPCKGISPALEHVRPNKIKAPMGFEPMNKDFAGPAIKPL